MNWSEKLDPGSPRGLLCPGANAPSCEVMGPGELARAPQTAVLCSSMARRDEPAPATHLTPGGSTSKCQGGGEGGGGPAWLRCVRRCWLHTGVSGWLLTTKQTVCVHGHLNWDTIGTEHNESKSACHLLLKRKPMCII